MSAERTAEAMGLRVQGHTYASIGARLGITGEAARLAVKRGMAEARALTADEADELRDLESQRLERLLLALAPGIAVGDVPSINAARALSAELRVLWGTDAPTRAVTEIGVRTADDEGFEALLADPATRAHLAAVAVAASALARPRADRPAPVEDNPGANSGAAEPGPMEDSASPGVSQRSPD